MHLFGCVCCGHCCYCFCGHFVITRSQIATQTQCDDGDNARDLHASTTLSYLKRPAHFSLPTTCSNCVHASARVRIDRLRSKKPDAIARSVAAKRSESVSRSSSLSHIKLALAVFKFGLALVTSERASERMRVDASAPKSAPLKLGCGDGCKVKCADESQM